MEGEIVEKFKELAQKSFNRGKEIEEEILKNNFELLEYQTSNFDRDQNIDVITKIFHLSYKKSLFNDFHVLIKLNYIKLYDSNHIFEGNILDFLKHFKTIPNKITYVILRQDIDENAFNVFVIKDKFLKEFISNNGAIIQESQLKISGLEFEASHYKDSDYFTVLDQDTINFYDTNALINFINLLNTRILLNYDLINIFNTLFIFTIKVSLLSTIFGTIIRLIDFKLKKLSLFQLDIFDIVLSTFQSSLYNSTLLFLTLFIIISLIKIIKWNKNKK